MLEQTVDTPSGTIASAIADQGDFWNSITDPLSTDCPRWKKLAESGLFTVVCDQSRPRAERCEEILIAMEQLGESCTDNGFVFSVATHLASTLSALDKYGSDELCNDVLAELTNGNRIGAHAISEPEAGSDALAMRTQAIADGDDYLLSGHKAFVTNAPIADVFVIYAKTSNEGGAGSVSAFLIDRNTPGLNIGSVKPLAGLTTSLVGELHMENCRISAKRMIGRPGAGFMVLSHVMRQEILYSFIANVGQMKRRLNRCVKHVQKRRQFDQPIGNFQSISNRIADMKMRYELSRQYLYYTAERQAQNKDVTSEIAITKVFISESALSTSIDAVHIHGGQGYLQETKLACEVSDALAGPIYSGTNDIQRGRIAAMMGASR